ncbi:putative GNAT family N-acyltransferase [Oxalobacteraceae bacterium GrIS 1.18]
MSASDFRIKTLPLSNKHRRDQFSCGTVPLDTYLRNQASQDAKRHLAAPFVLIEPPADEVLGYYTLSSSSVDLTDLPENLSKKLPRYGAMPVILTGRLAIDLRLKGKGFGEFLLMDALCRSAHNPIAAMAVIVDAKDQTAKSFYQHFGFIPLQKKPMRLFLPMTTIKKLFP